MNAFALIGAAGYIAPRHLAAIKAIGCDLKVAFDPNDSVGILDSHFPDAHFFTEFERFDRHVDKLRRRGEPITYMSICSPNYLHDSHVRFALRSGADAICEKPLVLNPWNIDGLAEIEGATGHRVSTILQLRLHPAIQALKTKVAGSNGRHAVDLTYITSRGRWYGASWKGDDAKSGGVATNIGVHFFDMLGHLFGGLKQSLAHLREPGRAAGFLAYERADVRWFMSVDQNDLPHVIRERASTFRSLTIDGEEVDFTGGFLDLHTRSYEEIMARRGFGLDDVRASVELVSLFRGATLTTQGERHALAHKYLKA